MVYDNSLKRNYKQYDENCFVTLNINNWIKNFKNNKWK